MKFFILSLCMLSVKALEDASSIGENKLIDNVLNNSSIASVTISLSDDQFIYILRCENNEPVMWMCKNYTMTKQNTYTPQGNIMKFGITLTVIGFNSFVKNRCLCYSNSTTNSNLDEKELVSSVFVHGLDDKNSVPEGSDFILRCEFESKTKGDNQTPFKLKWILPKDMQWDQTRMSQFILPLNEYAISKRNILAIRNSVTADSGNYTCQIVTYSLLSERTEVDTRFKSTYAMRVKNLDDYVELVTKYNNDYFNFKANTTAVIGVCYSGYDWKLNPEWHDRDGVKLVNSRKYSIKYKNDCSILYIHDVRLMDSGTYVASDRRLLNLKPRYFNLTIEGVPNARVENAFLKPNEKAFIQCKVQSYPEALMTWTFQPCSAWLLCSEEFIEISRNITTSQGATIIESIYTLTFVPTSSGIIRCKAKNSIGTALDQGHVIIRDTNDNMTIYSTNEVIKLGDKVTITCAVFTFYFLNHIHWYNRNGQLINETKNIAINSSLRSYYYTKSLTFNTITESDRGQYECKARLRNSTIEKSITKMITPIEKPCPFPCGANTICESIDEEPTCSCQNGYVGDPFIGCRHECERDGDCNFKDMCSNFKCVNACIQCGKRATCIIVTGHRAVCKCPEGYIGNGYGTCIPECFEDSDCPAGKSVCSSGICKNACDGACGLGADCNFHGLTPVCSCPSNTTGDPFVRCVYFNEDTPGFPTSWIIGIVSFVVILITVVVYLCIRVKQKSNLLEELKAAGLANFEEGAVDQLNPSLTFDEQADLLPYDRRFEFPKEKLKLGPQLGGGAFGTVFKAYAEGIKPNEKETIVAVKMVKRNANNEIIKALVSELKIMVHMGRHLNVINLLGAVTKNVAKRELMVIVEYCHYGNIRNFLICNRNKFINQIDPNTGKINIQTCLDNSQLKRNSADTNSGCLHLSVPDRRQSILNESQANDAIELRNVAGDDDYDSGLSLNTYVSQGPYSNFKLDFTDEIVVTTADLISWSFQLASGMEYLSSMNVLHGDLAARNILLCKGYIVKICDFGLARSMYEGDNYKKKDDALLPVKWLALESLSDHVFSTYTDVWSFGIVLWELFSLATIPYPDTDSYQKLYEILKNGYRMEKPPYASDDIYYIMLECWSVNPKARPLFHVLKEKFAEILGEEVTNHYVAMNEPYLRANREHPNLKTYLSKVDPPEELAPMPPKYMNILPESEISSNVYVAMSSNSPAKEAL